MAAQKLGDERAELDATRRGAHLLSRTDAAEGITADILALRCAVNTEITRAMGGRADEAAVSATVPLV
jgi:hypothetical protein